MEVRSPHWASADTHLARRGRVLYYMLPLGPQLRPWEMSVLLLGGGDFTVSLDDHMIFFFSLLIWSFIFEY